MAARTASVSGDWSNTVTWGGAAVPVNSDTVTINSGVVVDFDVDQSGFAAGLGASTVNGTLRAKRTAGVKYLKMNGNLTISTTGTLDASDGSGGAYRSDASFTILLNGAFNVVVSGNAVINLICGEPTYKYVRLSQAESSGATTLHVDTDLTGDALWAATKQVRLNNINGANQTELLTISSITSTTVVLSGGIGSNYILGSYLVLKSRNITLLGTSSSSGTGLSGGISPVIGVDINTLATAISGAVNAIINGVLSNCANGVNAGNACVVNAPISGCTNAVNAGSGHILNNLITGCATGLNAGAGHVLTSLCVIAGNASGLVGGSGYVLRGTLMFGNTRDLNNVNAGQAFNTLLGSSTEFLNYAGTSRSLVDYFESLDHDQVAGAFRAWTKGGITSSVVSPVFDASRPRSYNAVCESATYPIFFQRLVQVPAGGSVYVRCYVRKDASMAYLPRLQVFSAEKEPLLSGSPDVEVQMTNSTNTWEVLEATVTNTTDAPKLYVVRCLAKNASDNVYFDPIIRTSSYINQLGMEAA